MLTFILIALVQAYFAFCSIISEYELVPNKSPNDKRDYQITVLSNSLKVLLVHDPELQQSAASISVDVGGLFQPQTSLGGAHFLQHMLFMGSKKFPDPNQYATFITQNGGKYNAYTSDIETNYFFSIKNDKFFQTIERLTNFFSGTLLDPTQIQKQRNAVHQQFKLKSVYDEVKIEQILKTFAEKPYSQFRWGNNQTLFHDGVYKDVRDFYNQYYSSNIMTAVLMSNYTIDQMKQKAFPFLLQIPNKKVKLPQFQPHFKKEKLGKLVKVQSPSEQPALNLVFIVEPLRKQLGKHVAEYVGNILGHEAKNSLLSMLKLKKYASAITAFANNLLSNTILGFQILLTKQGYDNFQQVYSLFMEYIKSLKAQKNIYDQLKQANQINFRYPDKYQSIWESSYLSQKMHRIPLPFILNQSVVFQNFQIAEPTINQYLRSLNQQNLLLALSSSADIPDSIQQKYFKGKYKVFNLPVLKKSNVQFQSIPNNPFIPISNKQPKIEPKRFFPRKIMSNVYFLKDTSFQLDKGVIQMRVIGNQEEQQFYQFYVRYLNLLLKQVTYPAQILSASISYQSGFQSLYITIFGITDTVTKLIRKLAQKIEELHYGERSRILFEIAKSARLSQLQDYYKQPSYIIGLNLYVTLLIKDLSSNERSIQRIKKYTYQSMIERIRLFWFNNVIRWVAVGNFEQNSLKSLIRQVQPVFSVNKNHQRVKVPNYQSMKLTKDVRYEIFLQSPDVDTSAAVVYFQLGPYSHQDLYQLMIINNYIVQPLFTQLRSNKNLAYVVTSKVQNARGVLGVQFHMSSSVRDAKNISDQIKLFVHSFMGNMSRNLLQNNSSLFKTLIQSVYTRVHSPENNLVEVLDFISSQIQQNTYYFKKKQADQIRSILNKITVEQLQQTWQKMSGRTLQIYVVNHQLSDSYIKTKSQSGEKVQCFDQIRQNNEYWTDYQNATFYL